MFPMTLDRTDSPLQQNVPEVSLERVAERLESGVEAVYLDVRTVAEFELGHAPGAFNVPLFVRSDRTGAVIENTDFLSVVRAALPEQAEVFVGCAHGIRSFHAARLLLEAGWRQVANVGAGWDGKRDFVGRVLSPGWRDAGLPVSLGDGGDRSYRALRQRAGARSDG
jgi:E3 ubiquitin-protein ligase RNF13